MDFSWTREQRGLAEAMRALGAEVAALPAHERLAALAERGVLGLSLPKAHGGGGHDLLTTALAFESLGATLDDAGVFLVAGAHLFGVAMTIARAGSDAQQSAWLPDLAAGRRIASVAATEEQVGSDIAACRASIADHASGDKRYVTYADRAGLFLFVGQHHKGLTVGLVPGEADGVIIGPLYDTPTLASARLGPVRFHDVPIDSLLGKPGTGMAVFQIAMSYERALILAFRLGAMQRELDAAVARSRRVVQHQAVSHRLARMKLRLETARLVVYRAAWLLDRGERAHAEAALAKWHVSEAAFESAADALRLHGAEGITDARFTRHLDEAMAATIHSGTSDVLANVVAAWLR